MNYYTRTVQVRRLSRGRENNFNDEAKTMKNDYARNKYLLEFRLDSLSCAKKYHRVFSRLLDL